MAPSVRDCMRDDLTKLFWRIRKIDRKAHDLLEHSIEVITGFTDERRRKAARSAMVRTVIMVLAGLETGLTGTGFAPGTVVGAVGS